MATGSVKIEGSAGEYARNTDMQALAERQTAVESTVNAVVSNPILCGQLKYGLDWTPPAETSGASEVSGQ